MCRSIIARPHITMCITIGALLFVTCMASFALADLPSSKSSAVSSSSTVRLYYKIKGRLPNKVVLWVRKGKEGWQAVAEDDPSGFMLFTAKEEDYYTFLILPKGEKPSDGNGMSCLIDFSPPIVNIVGALFDRGRIYLSWSAYDRFFSSYPIEVYLVKDDGNTRFIGRFANTGKTSFSLEPSELPCRVKIIAFDLAGNSATAVSGLITAPAGSLARVDKEEKTGENGGSASKVEAIARAEGKNRPEDMLKNREETESRVDKGLAKTEEGVGGKINGANKDLDSKKRGAREYGVNDIRTAIAKDVAPREERLKSDEKQDYMGVQDRKDGSSGRLGISKAQGKDKGGISKELVLKLSHARESIARMEYEYAERLLKEILEKDADCADANFGLGELYFRERKYTEAKRYLTKALDLGCSDKNVYLLLGRIAIAEGDFDHARDLLERLTRLDKTNLRGWIYLGDVYWIVGRQADARVAWLEALKLARKEGSGLLESNISARLQLLTDENAVNKEKEDVERKDEK